MKKIITLLFTLVIAIGSVFALAGCSLVSDNTDKYYQQVVAKVGSKTVTREEVLNAYNNYSFYTYYGYTEEQIFDMVYNMLVNQKIMVQEAEKTFVLNPTEENEIWESIRKTINSYIDTYEDEVRTLHGADKRVENEEEKEELKKFAEYVRNVPGKERKNTDTVVKSGFVSPKKEDNFYRYLAFNKYISLLQKQSVIYGYNLSREQAFEKEINRLYASSKDSKLVELYQNSIKQNLTISEQEIIDRYTLLLNKQIQNFAVADAYKKAVTTTTNTDLVLFHGDSPASYFYTQQILIQFSDETKEILKNHSGYVASTGSTYTVDEEIRNSYLQLRDELAKKIEITYKDAEGEEQKITFNEIWAQLQALVVQYETDGQTQQAAIAMAKKFFEYKFFYSSDKVTSSSGTVSADTKSLDSLWNLIGYVFASDSSVTNSFAKEFSDKAYELYDDFEQNEKYSINYAVTDYGIHFMMFTGVTVSGPVADSNYAELNNKTISMVTNQTVADYIYELILKEKESAVVSEKMAALNSAYLKDNKIEKILSSYKDFSK